MPLTLEQYAEYLDTRHDLGWPVAPPFQPAKARPHLERLPEVKAVTWNVYGTLLHIHGGELLFEHPDPFVMEVALEKTVQEFKMWKAMTRRPGKPSEYMRILYTNALTDLRMQPAVDKHPEILAEKAWESIIKKLMTNEYVFDTSFYGSLNDYSRKVAYYFHVSLQGTACFPDTAKTLRYVQKNLGTQGLIADGQPFSPLHIKRVLSAQSSKAKLEELIPGQLQVWSYEVKARKPSERPFREMLKRLKSRGIEPHEVLHVGSHIHRDIAPAKKLNMRTAFFAGDKTSTYATKAELRLPANRPDVLLTELTQIAEVVGEA